MSIKLVLSKSALGPQFHIMSFLASTKVCTGRTCWLPGFSE